MRSYLRGLLSEVERKNGWTLAEASGDVGPQGMQRLLNSYCWDVDGVRDDIRALVVDELEDADGGVLVVDETGFLKKGRNSAGVARQRVRLSAWTSFGGSGVASPEGMDLRS